MVVTKRRVAKRREVVVERVLLQTSVGNGVDVADVFCRRRFLDVARRLRRVVRLAVVVQILVGVLKTRLSKLQRGNFSSMTYANLL